MNTWLQTDFPADSGIPRWGCYFVVLATMPQLITGRRLTMQEVLQVRDRCLAIPTRDGRHTILGSLSELDGKPWELYLWDPGAVLNEFCKVVDPGGRSVRGWQVRDEAGWYPWAAPSRYFWTYRAVKWLRPKGAHWVLAEAGGLVVWNPDPNITGPNSGHWVGFALGAPA